MDAVAAIDGLELGPGDVVLLDPQGQAQDAEEDLDCIYAVLGTEPMNAGRYQWKVGSRGGMERTLRAKFAFMGAMLQDEARNKAYRQALQLALDTGPGSEGKIILDAGAGTGLLSCLAASAQADCTVVAMEMNPAVAKLCNATVKENCLEQRVVVVPQRTTDVADMGVLADVVVSETLDSLLLNEGIVATMRDALGRLAKADAIVIPSRITCHGQLVQLRSELRALVCETGGLTAPPALKSTASGHQPVVVRMDSAWVKSQVEHLLSAPAELFSVDFTTLQSATESLFESEVDFELISTAGAQVNALLCWWSAELFPGVTLSTDPTSAYFQNHWHHSLYPMVPTLVPATSSSIRVCVSHNDDEVQVRVVPPGESPLLEKRARVESVPARHELEEEEDLIPLGEITKWDRIALRRITLCLEAIRPHLAKATGRETVVDLSGLSLSPLLVPPGERLFFTLDSEVSHFTLLRFVAQHNPEAKVERLDGLDCEDIGTDAVIVVGCMPLVENQLDAALALLYACRCLGTIEACYPCKATVRAQLVRFAKLKDPLSIPDKLCGVNHTAVNKMFLSACQGTSITVPMWNYDFAYACSEQPQNLATIEYATKECVLAKLKSRFKVTKQVEAGPSPGEQHLALCAWVDWGALARDDFLSTEPMSGAPWTSQVYFVSLPPGHTMVLASISIADDSNKFRIDVTTA